MKLIIAAIYLLAASMVNARAVEKRQNSFSLCTTSAECTIAGETCFTYLFFDGRQPFSSCQDRTKLSNSCNVNADCQATEFCGSSGRERLCQRKFVEGAPEGTLCQDSTNCNVPDECIAYSNTVSACVRRFNITSNFGDKCSFSRDCPYDGGCESRGAPDFDSICVKQADQPDTPPVVQGLNYPGFPLVTNGTDNNNGTLPLPTNTTSPVNTTTPVNTTDPVTTPLPVNTTSPVPTPLPVNNTVPSVNMSTTAVISTETSSTLPSKESIVVDEGSKPAPVPAPATEGPVVHPTNTESKPVEPSSKPAEAPHPAVSSVEAHPAQATQPPASSVEQPAQTTQAPTTPPFVVASIVSVMSALGAQPTGHSAPAASPSHEAAPAPAHAPPACPCPSIDLSEVLKQLQEIKFELACFKDILYSINGTISAYH